MRSSIGRLMRDLLRAWEDQSFFEKPVASFYARKRISRLKSSDRPCAFGTDLLNDRVGREIGQEQGGDEQGAEDGFDAV